MWESSHEVRFSVFFLPFSCIHNCIAVSEARKAFWGWYPVLGVLNRSGDTHKGDADSEVY